MQRDELFLDAPKIDLKKIPIGRNLSVEFVKKQKVILYNNREVVKIVELKDKKALKLMMVEAVHLGATKKKVAEAFGICRQTLYNDLETYKCFGIEGLTGGYKPQETKSLRKQRKLNKENKIVGKKAELTAEIRKQNRESLPTSELDFTFGDLPPKEISNDDMPFSLQHTWKNIRYAGVFIYLIVLFHQFKWLELIIGYFGNGYRILMVFVFMVAKNIKSIEQLKNVRLNEVGLLLGIGKIPSVTVVWQWFHSVAELHRSLCLLKDFFTFQIKKGIVSIWTWFTDGHLLPYTGKEKVRKGYNTQRQKPEPGRTNLVTCDGSGRIVEFQIEEGKGDLRKRIVELNKNWKNESVERPIMCFDREGYGAEFFWKLRLSGNSC
jgi:transposase-like protein